MEILRGIAVGPGIAIGEAVVLDAEDFRIPCRSVARAAVEQEREKFRQAVEGSIAELERQTQWLLGNLGREAANVFAWHIGVLKDAKLQQGILRNIQEKAYSAAYATSTVMREYQRRFLQMSDPLLVERIRDVRDIERRLLRNILGDTREDLAHLTKPAVLIAHDLTPTQTAQLADTLVTGVALDVGGATSHTAILLHSWGRPSVIGLNDVSTRLSGGDTVIIDAVNQLVIANPDETTLKEYREQESNYTRLAAELDTLRDLPSITRDGEPVHLLSNVEFPHEARTSLAKGAEGVGLFRTEFLFLQPSGFPSEEDQYRAYVETVRAMEGRPVTIRTFDLGADKYTQEKRYEHERNPMLGLRSIRYSLANVGMFKTQLRAILRAAVEGEVRLMFPLLMSLMEFRQAKMTLHDAMEDLEEAGIPYRRELPVGIMLETPAAAIQVKEFCREVDFISIGTNDLLQYLVAVDRGNEEVSRFYDPSHPALLRTLADVVSACTKAGRDCSLCGEMAGSPLYALFLLGIGLRSFSMAPANIPEIKKLIRLATVAQARRVARRALTFETERQVTSYLREETRKLLPEDPI
ncbi:MAG: phosphoenolpyruvate--protein phosphotransferase [Phycisphaerae bacterium]|nr:MAG: phosphoenolpyruvate--protein phosphotransferase [Planctomycetota bacterium]KAB2950122.1 MAG: phosphoenolpyruvate--protein phosphotransferase [Phycisphaerae bacterium]MBE7456457.1 phosphoenolpyruvate--protein phosphotransferase [Planctomycetia bacterium]MCK6465335.1 phosphoenolpyruvate--protein phosphotransferase [Phycisphaerae bacterium]MCL4719243.1 phosphoenolpyruvate--protein phosphotransferase [Phycisphaerae bacterium]